MGMTAHGSWMVWLLRNVSPSYPNFEESKPSEINSKHMNVTKRSMTKLSCLSNVSLRRRAFRHVHMFAVDRSGLQKHVGGGSCGDS